MNEHNPLDLEGNEAARTDKAKTEALRRKTAAEDMRWLMSGPRGRRIIHGILEAAGIWRTSFTGNSETYFREGMRNIGLMVLAQINDACADSYTTMMQEAKENDRRSRNNDDGTSSN